MSQPTLEDQVALAIALYSKGEPLNVAATLAVRGPDPEYRQSARVFDVARERIARPLSREELRAIETRTP